MFHNHHSYDLDPNTIVRKLPIHIVFQCSTDLIESHHSGERWALCYRLADCLNLLHPTLNDPIPPHLIEYFTVDQLPNKTPVFEPESELLCGYCLTLAQVLSNHTFTADEEKQLTGLLFELVCYFADDPRAPRWIRSADAVKLIDEVAV